MSWKMVLQFCNYKTTVNRSVHLKWTRLYECVRQQKLQTLLKLNDIITWQIYTVGTFMFCCSCMVTTECAKPNTVLFLKYYLYTYNLTTLKKSFNVKSTRTKLIRFLKMFWECRVGITCVTFQFMDRFE